jgi:tagaturonate reductase
LISSEIIQVSHLRNLHAYLSNTKFFGGEDLSKVLDLEEVITEYITDIRERGMRAVVNDLALDD